MLSNIETASLKNKIHWWLRRHPMDSFCQDMQKRKWSRWRRLTWFKKLILNFNFTKCFKNYLECRHIVISRHTSDKIETTSIMQYQNQRKTKIFSFITLSAITHSAINSISLLILCRSIKLNRFITIVLLYASTRAILMKMTFRDFRKDNIERVHDVREVIFDKINSKSIKLSSKEEMR